MSSQKVVSRVEVPEADVLHTILELSKQLRTRLDKHGPLSYIGAHEVYGICAEEVAELLDAIRQNDKYLTINELYDIAVAAIFGIASLNAHKD